MKKMMMVLLGLLFVSAGTARADQKPFNLSLVNPVQIVDADNGVSGVRLNLLYGKNTIVHGLDLGLGVGHSSEDFTGVGIHYAANFVQGNAKGVLLGYAANIVTGDFKGLQWGVANFVNGNYEGGGLGLVNIVEKNDKGFKLGIFNFANENFSGLQLGLVNIGGLKHGLQIGLININRNKKPLPFFIIANAG